MHFKHDQLLKDYSTFGIGGPARWLVEVKTIEEMQSVLQRCSLEKLAYIVIGKGSNSLFDDRGFDGVAIINKIHFCEFKESAVFVGSGYSFALLGVQTARKGLAGLEFASGIPASVGGAIYMNAGASGAQVSDVISEVIYVTDSGEVQRLSKNQLQFGYRSSSFQGKGGSIVAATFTLQPSTEARQKQLGIVDYRTKTQPYGDLSCGCVFRNPEGGSAGRLIQECGLKGKRMGGAEVSTLHANFIVNAEGAKASDVLELAKHIVDTVHVKTGVALEMELCVIPYTISR